MFFSDLHSPSCLRSGCVSGLLVRTHRKKNFEFEIAKLKSPESRLFSEKRHLEGGLAQTLAFFGFKNIVFWPKNIFTVGFWFKIFRSSEKYIFFRIGHNFFARRDFLIFSRFSQPLCLRSRCASALLGRTHRNKNFGFEFSNWGFGGLWGVTKISRNDTIYGEISKISRIEVRLGCQCLRQAVLGSRVAVRRAAWPTGEMRPEGLRKNLTSPHRAKKV